MEAKMFLFAIREFGDEKAPFSHVSLSPSVADILKKFNDDFNLIAKGGKDTSSNHIFDYFKKCSLWCLGSIDFLTGELVSCLEEHDKFIDVLEVLKNEY